MEALIPVINKLQDVFNKVGSEMIQLPQIVVLGSQSAGKSSVIEALVGSSFLPQGSGIVTRRPLILQLINCPLNDRKHRSDVAGTTGLKLWGEFLHNNILYDDFDEIRQEIENETDRVAGTNKGIISEPINLKIYSTDMVNLTLVDLPGLTKVPVGEQPKDIEKQIKQLIMKYIENPNSIILAVTPANADIANSDALKIAKNIDPKGARTLAVLTKLDLMDEGTDATEVLTGSIVPVKLGIIGVINRSQKDINDSKAMEDQLYKESTFLAEKYPALASTNGTPYLKKTMNRLLMKHISECLPDLRQRVLAKSSETQKLLDLYGKEIKDKDMTLISIINQFTKSYTATIEGIKAIEDGNCGTTEIYEIIHEKLGKTLHNIDPCLNLKAEDALTALFNAYGPRPTLFNDPRFDIPFEDFVKKQVALLQMPSLDCVSQVHAEMSRNIRNCGSSMQIQLERFPRLQEKIGDVVTMLLRENLETTRKSVEDVMRMEIAYINKKHPDFNMADIRRELTQIELSESGGLNLKKLFKQEFKEITVDKVANFDPEQMKNCLIFRGLVKIYFNIVRKSVLDSVPKAVVLFLVNATRDTIENELMKGIYKADGSEEILNESDHIMRGRVHAKAMLNALLVANQIIGEVSDSADNNKKSLTP